MLTVNPVVVGCDDRGFQLLPPIVCDNWASSVKRIGQGDDRTNESLLARRGDDEVYSPTFVEGHPHDDAGVVAVAQNEVVPFLRGDADRSVAESVGRGGFSPDHHSHTVGPRQGSSIGAAFVDSHEVEAHVSGEFQVCFERLGAGRGEVGARPVALVENAAQVGGLVVDLEIAVREVDVANSHVRDNLVFTHTDARVDEVGVGGRPQ